MVDTGYRNVTSGDNKYSGIQNGGNASNRLGFKGTEDIEGGMKANFVMEGDLTPNDGTAAGFKFLRQSTVGLTGGFGEVRLGRDYTPTFRVFGMVDPFGYVGVGSSGNIMGSTVMAASLGAGTAGAPFAFSAQDTKDGASTFTTIDAGTEKNTDTTPSTATLRAPGLTTARVTIADPNVVRANNSFAYYTPVMSGFSANVMYTTGAQNTYSLKNVGVMTAVGLNYTNGPLNVAYANQATKGGASASAGSSTTTRTVGTDSMTYTVDFVAATYDLGMAKLGLGYRTDKLAQAGFPITGNTKSTIYALTAPMGAVTLKASYITKKVGLDATINGISASGSMNAGDQFAIGAQYDLSKRTALYGTYAQLSNKAGFANSVGGAAASAGGVKSSGFDIGVRHSF